MKKVIGGMIIMLLCSIGGVQASDHTDRKMFELLEAPQCEIATDGCNSYKIENNKLINMNNNYCVAQRQKVFSCILKKGEVKAEEKERIEFMEQNKATCQVATDTRDMFLNKNGVFIANITTDVVPDVLPVWACEKEFAYALTPKEVGRLYSLEDSIPLAKRNLFRRLLVRVEELLAPLSKAKQEKVLGRAYTKLNTFIEKTDKAYTPDIYRPEYLVEEYDTKDYLRLRIKHLQFKLLN